MKTRVDERLRSEARTFGFRFGCEDCAYYASESGACGNGYPSMPHRAVLLAERDELEFCKEFELGGEAG